MTTLLALCLCVHASTSFAQGERTPTPTSLSVTPSGQNLSVSWNWSQGTTNCEIGVGSDHHNDGYELQYRKAGSSWREAALVYRAGDPDDTGNYGPNNAENGSYEIRSEGSSVAATSFTIGTDAYSDHLSFGQVRVDLTPGTTYYVRVRAYSAHCDPTDPRTGADPDDNPFSEYTRAASATVPALPDPGLELSVSTLTVNEGSAADFTVKLKAEPTGTVTVAVASTDGTSATVSPQSLTFSTTDWNETQDVTVTGVQDVDTMNDSARITLRASGADYGSVSGAVDVTVDDDDVPGLMLSVSTLTVDEGSAADFTVRLGTEPTGTVTVAVASTDETSATVSPQSLTFSTMDWNVTQDVTVTGVQDADTVNDSARITLRAAGADYGSVSDAVDVTVDDDDDPGLVLSVSTLTVNEGSAADFTVKLSTEPTGTVTVAVASTDETSATVSPQSLTFSTMDWNVTQDVTVTGVQDVDAVNDSARITLRAAGTDYGSVSDAVDVTVDDDDEAVGGDNGNGGNGGIGGGIGGDGGGDDDGDDGGNDGGTGPVPVIPDPPTDLQVTAGPGRLEVRWTAPAGGAAGYEIEFTRGAVTRTQAVPGVTTATIENLDSGRYSVRVRSRIDGEYSNFTEAIVVWVNHAPIVVNPIGDRTVAAGASLVVELEASGAAVFVDHDGHELSYSAATSDAATAVVEIEGNRLIVTGKAAGKARIVVTAVDEAGISAEDAFTVTVDGVPRFPAGASIADQAYTQHGAVDALTLPLASGGDGTPVYSLSPALPEGLTFDASLRSLSGTPVVAFPPTEYTYTAADEDGDAASLTFILSVDGVPRFPAGASIADQAYTQHEAVDALTLPLASGGDGTPVYSLSPALPEGLTFDASLRSLSGTPVVALPPTEYVYTATDADDDTASLTFVLSVDGVPRFAAGASIADQAYTQHGAVDALTLPLASGGDGTLTYSLRPALPEGLTFDAASRSLSGTPVVALPPTEYVYTATDADGDTASLTFILSVMPPPAPTLLGRLPDIALLAGGAAATVNAAVFDGFGLPLTYQAASSDEQVARVSGGETIKVAPGTEGATTVTVTASTSSGSASATFEVTVSTSEAETVALNDALSGQTRAVLNSATSVLGERFSEAPAARGVETAADLLWALAGAHGPDPQPGSYAHNGASPGYSAPATAYSASRSSGTAASPYALSASSASVSQSHGMSAPGHSAPAAAPAVDDLLWRQSFAFSLDGPENADPGVRFSAWGAGDIQRFSGSSADGATYDGDLRTVYLGIDVGVHRRLLIGVAGSRAWGVTEYAFSQTDASGAGELTTRLQTAYPYIYGRWDIGLELWGMGGLGTGELDHARDHVGGAAETSDLRSRLGSMGLRQHVTRLGSMTMSLVGDAGYIRLETDDGPGVADGLRTEASSGRLGFEGAWTALTSRRDGVSAFWQASARADGGDGETEMGAELAGGLRLWGGPVAIRLNGRYLALHSVSTYEEWGASANLEFRSSGGGEGLSASISPRYGVSEGGGAQALWGGDLTVAALGAPASRSAMATGTVAYGVRLMNGRALLTPYGAFEADGTYQRIGVRLGPAGDRPRAAPFAFELGVDRSGRQDGRPVHSVNLVGRIGF